MDEVTTLAIRHCKLGGKPVPMKHEREHLRSLDKEKLFYKALVMLLVGSRERSARSGRSDNLVGPTSNLEDSCVEPLAESSCQSDELVAVDMHSEYIPEQPEIPEGTSLNLDVGTAVVDSDGLSDPNDLSDDADIIEVSDLKRFASALQEARCCAIQLEGEKAKQRHMYQGNSRTTLYCCEKACRHWHQKGFLALHLSWP
jgi:hypothetical protein